MEMFLMQLNPSELDLEFKKYLFDKYPDAFKKYDLAVYQKGIIPKENDKADINSPTVQLLYQAFYKALFLNPNPKHYSLLFNITLQFAKRFKDGEREQRLHKIWDTCGKAGYSLPLIEKVVFRDTISMQFKLGKSYNYARHSKRAYLGDLIVSLDDAEQTIINIFNEICAENDVVASFNLSDLTEQTGMPKL